MKDSFPVVIADYFPLDITGTVTLLTL